MHLNLVIWWRWGVGAGEGQVEAGDMRSGEVCILFVCIKLGEIPVFQVFIFLLQSHQCPFPQNFFYFKIDLKVTIFIQTGILLYFSGI